MGPACCSPPRQLQLSASGGRGKSKGKSPGKPARQRRRGRMWEHPEINATSGVAEDRGARPRCLSLQLVPRSFLLQILQHSPARGDVLAQQHRFSHFPALSVPKGRPGPAPCPCAPGRGEPWQEEGLSVLGQWGRASRRNWEELGGMGRVSARGRTRLCPQPPVQWPGWSRFATHSLKQQRYPECACTPTTAKEQETWHKYSSRLIYMRLQKAQLQPPAGGCYLRRSASCLTPAPAGFAQPENPEVGCGECPSPPQQGLHLLGPRHPPVSWEKGGRAGLKLPRLPRPRAPCALTPAAGGPQPPRAVTPGKAVVALGPPVV